MSSDCSSAFASNYIEEAGQKNNSPQEPGAFFLFCV